MIALLPLNKFIAQSESLYLRSFPAEERRDWTDILNNNHKENFDFLEIHFNDTFAGIISVWRFFAFIYVEHFAIEVHLRSKGIGSATLKTLKDMYQMPVVLEVDTPCDKTSIERVRFYTKNGFHPLKDKYIQPPYKQGLPSVEMKIMTTDTSIAFSSITTTLYRYVYRVL